jgi:YHS domain-containing protein
MGIADLRKINHRGGSMAHRSNIIQVNKNPDSNTSPDTITDPVCGMKLPKKEAKSVLFRPDQTYYFCSKDCQNQFLYPKKTQKKAS